jgi:hypothetical protein
MTTVRFRRRRFSSKATQKDLELTEPRDAAVNSFRIVLVTGPSTNEKRVVDLA